MADNVKSLEQAVSKLDERELKRFAAWFDSYRNKLWDAQMARDVKAGKLDFLAQEALKQKRQKSLKDL